MAGGDPLTRLNRGLLLSGGALLLNYLNPVHALKCFCKGHCPHNPYDPQTNGTCEAKPGASCFKAVEEVRDPETNQLVPEYTFGCLPPDETGFLQCKGHLVPHLNPTSIGCCQDEDYCNLKLSPRYVPTTEDEELEHFTNGLDIDTKTLNVLLISLCALFIIALVVIFFAYHYFKRKEESHQKYMRHDPEAAMRLFPGRLNDLIESSGSGSGLPMIVQRTICRQLVYPQEDRPIGKGRFGIVWLAKFRNLDEVAVKHYDPKFEASWSREMEIYNINLVRNQHILGFIAADINGQASRVLITDYHPNGSLFHFLMNNTVDLQTMLKMASGIASGINHLHSEINGTSSKPKIAHRDIKSRNILVKEDYSCCIADFALAVKYNRIDDKVDHRLPPVDRIGTVRYMAPEVLGNKLNDDFDLYLKADVYSFALVLWELCRRTKSGTEKKVCEEFELPYNEYIKGHNQEPTFEDMEVIVLKEEKRPSVPSRWETNEVLSTVSRIIRESWCSKPAARLPMLQIKKRLIQLDKPKPEMNEKYAKINSTLRPSHHIMTS